MEGHAKKPRWGRKRACLRIRLRRMPQRWYSGPTGRFQATNATRIFRRVANRFRANRGGGLAIGEHAMGEIAKENIIDEQIEVFGADVSDEWLEAAASAHSLGGAYTEFAYCTQVLCPG